MKRCLFYVTTINEVISFTSETANQSLHSPQLQIRIHFPTWVKLKKLTRSSPLTRIILIFRCITTTWQKRWRKKSMRSWGTKSPKTDSLLMMWFKLVWTTPVGRELTSLLFLNTVQNPWKKIAFFNSFCTQISSKKCADGSAQLKYMRSEHCLYNVTKDHFLWKVK